MALLLFERIISGDLSPFKTSTNSEEEYRKQLAEKHRACFTITDASFKRSGNKYSLVSKSVIHSLNPFWNEVFSEQQDLFQEITPDDLNFDAYTLLGIDRNQVKSVVYMKEGSRSMLRIKQAVNWSVLPFEELRYYYYVDIMREEVRRIKQKISSDVFEFGEHKKIELYIHNLQQSLINLCFQLLRQYTNKQQNDIYKPARDFTESDILNYCFVSMERLLRFLEKNYLRYIDENIKIPFRSSLLKAYQIEGKLEVVKACFLSSAISPMLLKIIYAPLLKINSISLAERVTYKELIYCTAYLDAFYYEIKECGNHLHVQQIIDILYHVNFNCIEFQNYEVSAISESTMDIEELTGKIDYLYHRLKVTNQRNCRVNIKYDPGLPSLKMQLVSWIEEELAYLNKRLLLSLKREPATLFSDEDKPKLQSGFTVAQLALFYRVQADAGIITHRVQTDIFKHIADSYKTSKAIDISADSVKNRFYNIDEATIEAVKEKTIEILNQLRTVQTGSL